VERVLIELQDQIVEMGKVKKEDFFQLKVSNTTTPLDYRVY